MTRDEAVRAFDGIAQPGSFGTTAWIDRLVALGILKLDEPKSVDDKLLKALAANGYAFLKPETLRVSLDSSGLKIVEK